jgi:hypothetical protein
MLGIYLHLGLTVLISKMGITTYVLYRYVVRTC